MTEKNFQMTKDERNFIETIAKVYAGPEVTRTETAQLIQDIEQRNAVENKSFLSFSKFAGAAAMMVVCLALIWVTPASQDVQSTERESELIWSTLMLDGEDFTSDFADEFYEEEFEEDVDEFPEEYAVLTMIIAADASESLEFVE